MVELIAYLAIGIVWLIFAYTTAYVIAEAWFSVKYKYNQRLSRRLRTDHLEEREHLDEKA